MIPPDLLTTTAADGVLLYSGHFERIVDSLRASLTALGGLDDAQSLRTPPVIARSVIEQSGYVETFPNLLGTVHRFDGTSQEWTEQVASSGPGSSWHRLLEVSDLVLLPAGCYCLYPLYQDSAVTSACEHSVEATCFRQEGSNEAGRFRSFRMREFVRIGAAEDCVVWRDGWLERAGDWLTGLGLTPERELANDPFFGTVHRMMSATQRQQELKWELSLEVAPGQRQAVASFNYHKDHFGDLFRITDAAGSPRHTACAAFGYERLALALVHRHGPKPGQWPPSVRTRLGIGAAT